MVGEEKKDKGELIMKNKKKILAAILILLAVALSPVTTVYEDNSKTIEPLATHLFYKYVQVPMAHLNK